MNAMSRIAVGSQRLQDGLENATNRLELICGASRERLGYFLPNSLSEMSDSMETVRFIITEQMRTQQLGLSEPTEFMSCNGERSLGIFIPEPAPDSQRSQELEQSFSDALMTENEQMNAGRPLAQILDELRSPLS